MNTSPVLLIWMMTFTMAGKRHKTLHPDAVK